MLETGQQDIETTADTHGALLGDVTVIQFFEEISDKRERSEVWEQHQHFDQRHYLINCIHKNYFKNGMAANALSYAIHHESDSLVQQMLEELKLRPPSEQMLPISATDGERNNALQKLIWTIERREMPHRTTRTLVKGIVKTLMTFDLDHAVLTNRNMKGESALAEALRCTKDEYNEWLFINLMELRKFKKRKRLQAIQSTQEKCSSDGCMPAGTSDHVPDCTKGYNLLMLALASGNSRNIAYLVKIVCDADRKHKQLKLKILIGNRNRTMNAYVPNSIHVAAKHGQWKALKSLLESIANKGTTNLANMLIDKDERLDSAMKWIVRAHEGTEVEALLKLSNSKLRNDLNDAFHSNYDRNEFMKLEMSVESIKAFHDADLFVDSFLLPQPSRDERLSRPQAMICYNAFDDHGSLQLVNTRIAAKTMQWVLNDLGWEIKNEDLISGWSFTELKGKVKSQVDESKHHASIFLLCVATHGRGNKIAGETDDEAEEYELGHINEIVHAVSDNAESSIPKVIIIESCRDEKESEHEPIYISENNMLLLMATSYRQDASSGLYLEKLADEIAKADGVTTLEEMHYNITKNITKMKYESGNQQVEDDGDDDNDRLKMGQNPRKYSTAGRITLRNWKK